jgi:hypothetical protein
MSHVDLETESSQRSNHSVRNLRCDESLFLGKYWGCVLTAMWPFDIWTVVGALGGIPLSMSVVDDDIVTTHISRFFSKASHKMLQLQHTSWAHWEASRTGRWVVCMKVPSRWIAISPECWAGAWITASKTNICIDPSING